jgi:hypothetical protein
LLSHSLLKLEASIFSSLLLIKKSLGENIGIGSLLGALLWIYIGGDLYFGYFEFLLIDLVLYVQAKYFAWIDLW